MESMKKQVSDRFPVDYGDFVLKSSDDLLFYFSRAILAYVSDFFRCMFELPSSDETQGTAQKPLIVTETADVLKGFLEQIDAKTLPPGFGHDSVVDILEAARKYQVPVIITRFEAEIHREHQLRNVASRSSDLLLLSHPLVVLYIALHHDIESVGKWAIQELARCSSRFIEEENVEIPAKASQYIQKLRRGRIQHFQKYIDILAKTRPPRQAGSSQGPFMRFPEDTCIDCATYRSEWLLQLDRSLEREPNWKTFARVYSAENPAPCVTCKGDKSRLRFGSGSVSRFSEWAIEVRRLEDSGPAWPIM
ncbi:hypothetical protein FRC14_006420 [Serendipita sp. 396]|nr:hypothetical protein FRC14_006420 [Serendipita sp. 396]KAG8795747.1 hypothetical protein FRC16_009983 [Serendipita sp. 398]KAG8817665.1 hypothetical protein FRC19_011220 [Serendipita sp. 401]KAG8856009.1 hypothetical protein FRC20_000623 [Serendipita sp. 405]